MADTMTTQYVVTSKPEHGGMHFVHTEECQALTETETETLGKFETCAPAMEKARESLDRVDACALCCSDCHEASEESRK